MIKVGFGIFILVGIIIVCGFLFEEQLFRDMLPGVHPVPTPSEIYTKPIHTGRFPRPGPIVHPVEQTRMQVLMEYTQRLKEAVLAKKRIFIGIGVAIAILAVAVLAGMIVYQQLRAQELIEEVRTDEETADLPQEQRESGVNLGLMKALSVVGIIVSGLTLVAVGIIYMQDNGKSEEPKRDVHRPNPAPYYVDRRDDNYTGRPPVVY
jgi:hypothetical protein